MRRGASTVRERVLAVLSLGMVLGLGAVGTMAIWTDTSSTTSTFATGTATLRLDSENAQSKALTTLDLTGLAPGYTRAGLVTVRNRGTLPLIYSVGVTTSTDAKDLQSSLTAVVTTDATVVGSGNSATCSSGTSTVFSRTGLAGTAQTVGGQLNPLGQTAADQVLCIQVGLPTGSSTSLQGASTTATFTFTGTTF